MLPLQVVPEEPSKLSQFNEIFPGVIYSQVLKRKSPVKSENLVDGSILEDAVLYSLKNILVAISKEIIPDDQTRILKRFSSFLQPKLNLDIQDLVEISQLSPIEQLQGSVVQSYQSQERVPK
jgi:hypothetical protein